MDTLPPYPNFSALFQIDYRIWVLQREFQVVQHWHIQTASFVETSQEFIAVVPLRPQQTVDTAVRDRGLGAIEANNRGACHRAHCDTPVQAVEGERKVT